MTDCKTENKLICFEDGSYIELIAFINDLPQHRAGHHWGDKKSGIIDFALTSDEEAGTYWEGLNERLEKSGVSERYKHPAAGGRLRDDGIEVRWQVTFPPEMMQRGEVPFLCHDVTARELRAPVTKEALTHPCGAYGLKNLSVILPLERIAYLEKVYAALLNVPHDPGSGAVFTAGRVRAVGREGIDDVTIRVHGPSGKRQEDFLAERGALIGEMVFGGVNVADGTETFAPLDSWA